MHQGELLFFLFGIAMFTLFIIVSGVSIGESTRRARREAKINQARNKTLADWAQSRGLSFRPGADDSIGNRYFFLDCLQKEHNTYSYNIMEGIIGNRKVCAFDYHYEFHNGRAIIHQYFSAVVVEIGLPLKPLFIRTEKFRDRIAESAGVEDIDFESAEFNKTFYVKSPDKKWAYDVINQAIMELLLNYCHFNIEFNGLWVIAYRDELFSAGYFEEALQLLTGIVDNLPESMVRELKEGRRRV